MTAGIPQGTEEADWESLWLALDRENKDAFTPSLKKKKVDTINVHLLFYNLGARWVWNHTLLKGCMVDDCASGVCRNTQCSTTDPVHVTLNEIQDESHLKSSQVRQWPDTNTSAFALGFQKLTAPKCGRGEGGVPTVCGCSKPSRVQSSHHCKAHCAATALSVNNSVTRKAWKTVNCHSDCRLEGL